MNKLNRENLKKMMDFVKTIPEEFIEMEEFRQTDETTIECKSSGCIIGWCTELDKENITKNFIDSEDNCILFYDWSFNFLNLELKDDQSIWEFMFAYHWSNNKQLILNRMNYIYYKSLNTEMDKLNVETSGLIMFSEQAIDELISIEMRELISTEIKKD